MQPPMRTESWSHGARSPGGRRSGGEQTQDEAFRIPERARPRNRRAQKENVMQTKLSTEVRQSLSLLAMTALTLIASIGLGILAGQLG